MYIHTYNIYIYIYIYYAYTHIHILSQPSFSQPSEFLIQLVLPGMARETQEGVLKYMNINRTLVNQARKK